MAEEDRAHLGSTPEQHLAARFSADLKLTVPVDIQTLFHKYADVEIAKIPGTFEALLVRKPKNRVRPLLITNYELTIKTRYRFTLAHELAHMLIPWQTGTILCNASITYQASQPLSRQMEAEANRFASELLVPLAWASERLKDPGETLANRIHEMAREAQVSAEVAVLAAHRALPADTILLLVDSAKKICLSKVSPESMFADVPARGELLNEKKLGRLGELSKAKLGSRYVYALDCSASTVGAMSQPDTRELSNDVLANILGEIEPNDDSRHALLCSVNGIVGYANNLAKLSRDESIILATLHQRFVRFKERADLAAVIEHPRFHAYLAVKARELAAKR
jgi:Zn-dependent peptidase ImmA (M78 family)